MKYVKMLGLAAVATMAFMAFAASTASATVLCTNTGCTTVYPAKTTIEATSSHTRLVAAFGTVTCTTNEIEALTKNEGNKGEAVEGIVTNLNFGNCNGTVIDLAGGALAVHYKNAHEATLTSAGAQVTTSLFGVHCVWGTGSGTTLGTVKGGETPTIAVRAVVEKLEGSPFCGSTATWEGTYTIHKPHALFFGEGK
jgi:hypothetical protein